MKLNGYDRIALVLSIVWAITALVALMVNIVNDGDRQETKQEWDFFRVTYYVNHVNEEWNGSESLEQCVQKLSRSTVKIVEIHQAIYSTTVQACKAMHGKPEGFSKSVNVITILIIAFGIPALFWGLLYGFARLLKWIKNGFNQVE